jgi:hypothetical protein
MVVKDAARSFGFEAAASSAIVFIRQSLWHLGHISRICAATARRRQLIETSTADGSLSGER